jgi:hypothetical protein
MFRPGNRALSGKKDRSLRQFLPGFEAATIELSNPEFITSPCGSELARDHCTTFSIDAS